MKTSTVNVDLKIVELLREYKKLNRIGNISEFVKSAILDKIYSLSCSEVVERYKKYCKMQIKSKYREKEAELVLSILFNLDMRFIEDIKTLNISLLRFLDNLLTKSYFKEKYDFVSLSFFIESCERFAKNYEDIKAYEESILYNGGPLNSKELKEYANAAFDPFDDEDFII